MKKILVVDDDAAFLGLLSHLLKKQFQLYEATGVNEALRIIETVPLDAVCSDFNMKDGTGLELLKTIHKKGMRLPFLLMSGAEERNIIHMAKRYGAIFCCKTDPDLIRKICSIVNI